MTDKKFNPEKADKLFSEERKALLPPDKLLSYLEIDSQDVVADLGAGNGYFTLPIAQKTTNTVYAVDIEPKMLNMLKENAAIASIDNIHYVESDLVTIKLEDQSVNKAMISMVMHEVSSIDQTVQEIKRIIKQDGKILIIEWKAIEMEAGPPLNHRLPAEELLEALKIANFNVEFIDLNSQHYAVEASLHD
ncbi:class I SAM-dependent methyltransferase [Aquibacillus sediminis]|uniref:class I SAM-dependent methyltransferase n=1 Tax=Aquibacillus sediminis TaxID=2574734 RepID=UPI001108FBE5|nr:class I SAM-dependent methyltransferase [Aquibacillus sediminis]